MESPIQNVDAGTARQRPVFNLPCYNVTPHWFAAYTVANHEQRVARQLADRAIPHYLPIYQSVRQWKDRKMRLDLPLFPGYVFVEIPLHDRLKVIQIPSVVHLVGSGGQPTPLRDSDVAAIRMCMEHSDKIEPHSISVGQTVRIVRGAFAGMEGVLERKKGISRLVLCVSLIMRAVAIEIDEADVAPIQQAYPSHASTLAPARKYCSPQFA
jgi:transcription antitermination factor NusG